MPMHRRSFLTLGATTLATLLLPQAIRAAQPAAAYRATRQSELGQRLSLYASSTGRHLVLIGADGAFTYLETAHQGTWQRKALRFASERRTLASVKVDPASPVGYFSPVLDQHVIVFSGDGGRLYELRTGADGNWALTDVLEQTGAPPRKTDTRFSAYYHTSSQTRQVFYADRDDHLVEVLGKDNDWDWQDLHRVIGDVPGGVPDLVAARLVGFEWQAAMTKHVACISNGDLHEYAFVRDGYWDFANLTQQLKLPAFANGQVAGFASEATGSQHLVWLDAGASPATLGEVRQDQQGQRHVTDLTGLLSGLSSPPVTMTAFATQATQIMALVDAEGAISVFEATADKWRRDTALGSQAVPFVQGNQLHAMWSSETNTAHLVYMSRTNALIELVRNSAEQWRVMNISDEAGL
jgi:hypothetical protein